MSVHHRQQHLADVLRLVVFAIRKLDLVELRNALNDVRHLVAKALRDLRRRDVRIFNGIVQQAGGDSRRVHLQLCKHLRHFKRMDDVRLATGPLLPRMLLQAEPPRRTDHLQVIQRPIGADRLQKRLEVTVNGRDLSVGESRQVGRCEDVRSQRYIGRRRRKRVFQKAQRRPALHPGAKPSSASPSVSRAELAWPGRVISGVAASGETGWTGAIVHYKRTR